MKLNPKSILTTLIIILGLTAVAFLTTSYFRYTSAGAVLAYLKNHPQDTAIACFDPANPGAGFYQNETEAYPLASTFKLVLLAAYADEVAAGKLDPQEPIPASALERYYLPGTDGGAHAEFLKAHGDGLTPIKLDDIVAGMVSYGSNADTDYLLSRLKTVDFPKLYQRLGLKETSQPFSFLGLYLFIKNHETGMWAEEDITPTQVLAEQARLADLFVNNPDWRAAEISFITKPTNVAPVTIQEQVIEAYGMRGSAKDISQIILAAYGENSPLSKEAQAILRRQLEWPLRLNPENTKSFKILASASGAWPGVLTTAWYAQPLKGQPLALVVFYRNMPDDFWNTWITTLTNQQLETEVLASGNCSLLSEALK